MMIETPSRDHLLRKSVINNMGAQSILTTPIRRSGVNNQSPVVDLIKPTSDDDERLRRRSAVAMQKRVSNIRSNDSPVVVLDRVISETETKEHLKLCTKLFTENKITVKNAWELKIIEVLRQLVAKGPNNMFQVVTSTLDIITKVYGIRVDDAHSIALQLANRLAESSRKKASEEVDSDELEGSEADQGRKKKKRNVRKKKNTIDREGASIFGPLTRLERTTFSTKEDPSISSTDNLFSSKLPMHPIGHRFCALTGEKVGMQDLDSSLFTEEVKVNLPKFLHKKFCPELRNFRLDEMDDSEYLVDNSQNEVVFDNDGLPIAELDGSIHDIFENGADDDVVSDVEEYQPEQMQVQIQNGIAHVVNALPEESRVEHDYGYNLFVQTASGKIVDKWWAGPFHWKLKCIKASKPKFSGTEAIEQRQKRTRKITAFEPMDFSSAYVDNTDYENDVIGTKAPATIKQERITFPWVGALAESLMKPKNQLLLKPVVLPCEKNSALPNSENEDVPVYNYENPNDSNYCSQHDIVNDDDDNHDNDVEDNQIFSQDNFAENLIDAPELVPQAQLAYSHQAKKMNMRKLKSSVWKVLTPQEELDEENLSVQPTSFMSLYSELPKHLSSSMKKELSPHLAFVALLHLCNEKTLHLTQIDKDNFNIAQG